MQKKSMINATQQFFIAPLANMAYLIAFGEMISLDVSRNGA